MTSSSSSSSFRSYYCLILQYICNYLLICSKKKFQTMAMENVEVLSVEDDAEQSVNEPMQEIVEDDMKSVLDDAVESVNEVVELDQPIEEIVEVIEDDKKSQMENIEVLRMTKDDEKLNGQGEGQRARVSVHVQTEEAELPQYCLLVKNPGYEDKKLNDQIKNAELQLHEKRCYKDAITDEIQIKWDNMLVHKEAFHAKNLDLRAATHLVKSKRQQIHYVERVISKLKNYTAVKGIDSKISKAKHIIKHGTLSLEDEKQFTCEIKQLKGIRVQLASNMGSLDEIQHVLDRKDQLEELVKNLNMELKTLKSEVSKAQSASHTIRKKYHEELEMGRQLRAWFIAAEESHKEASMHLHDLRKQLNDKVERFMGKWNTNEEFRKDYISQCNMLATQDADLKVSSESGPIPDEIEPSLVVANLETQEAAKSVEEQCSYDQIKENVLEEVEEMMKTKEPIEPTEIIEIKEKEKTDELMKEKIEAKLKIKETDELMKEEIEAKLKEKNRLEEKMKANEAQERKKRNAQKAPTRAEIKAQQEAQQQEKRRLKRSKKKEKKRAAQERKRAARDAATSSSTDDEVVAEANKSKEVDNTKGNSSAVAVVIRNQKPWRHWGSMVITVVILLLSIFSLLQ